MTAIRNIAYRAVNTDPTTMSPGAHSQVSPVATHGRSHVRADGTPKVPHFTRAHAKRAARELQRDTGTRMYAYLCPCGTFHVGHASVDTTGDIAGRIAYR